MSINNETLLSSISGMAELAISRGIDPQTVLSATVRGLWDSQYQMTSAGQHPPIRAILRDLAASLPVQQDERGGVSILDRFALADIRKEITRVNDTAPTGRADRSSGAA